MAKLVKENLVFDKTIITLESSMEHNLIWDLVENHYKDYPCGSPERDFLIKLSNMFCGCE